MAKYKDRSKKPEEGQMCIIKSNKWCELGFWICEFRDGKFQDDQNGMLDDDVEEWCALSEEGFLI